MTNRVSVIHKQILKVIPEKFLERQVFEVPIEAAMCEIAWDPREFDGVAFWYQIDEPKETDTGNEVKYWSFYIRRTGQPFPSACYHLATVSRDGFAWHILDADGANINWAPC
jgi:hypothetical protein